MDKSFSIMTAVKLWQRSSRSITYLRDKRPCTLQLSVNTIVRGKAQYVVVAVGLSGILKAKQKLSVTFNFDKEDVIDFTESKMTMCRALEANS